MDTKSTHLSIEPGSWVQLGANYDGEGVNFAIFSAHAERVELCIYDPSGKVEIARMDMPEYTHEVWHGYVPGLKPGALYGYRVHGPYDPENGHRFNPNKLLVDPYARELAGEVEWNGDRYGYGPQKCTTPTAIGSLAQRRGSPVAVIAVAVEPW